jgi:hypothetical protein
MESVCASGVSSYNAASYHDSSTVSYGGTGNPPEEWRTLLLLQGKFGELLSLVAN